MSTPSDHRRPPDWDEEHVQRVFAHYESRLDEPPAATLSPAANAPGDQLVLMEVPAGLVPEVRALIARHRGEDGATG
jgi:hypothetical protein